MSNKMYCSHSGKSDNCKKCDHAVQHEYSAECHFDCPDGDLERFACCVESKEIKSGLEETTLADRYNDGKLQWSLVDFESLESLVRVLEYGAKKYDTDQWKKGLHFRGVCESMMRHLIAYMKGEDIDNESGLSHLGHIQANAMFLAYYEKHKPELDNRKLKK